MGGGFYGGRNTIRHSVCVVAKRMVFIERRIAGFYRDHYMHSSGFW